MLNKVCCLYLIGESILDDPKLRCIVNKSTYIKYEIYNVETIQMLQLTLISNLIGIVVGKKSTKGRSKSKLNFSIQNARNAEITKK